MPKMRWEKIRTTDYRFSGKNLKKELIVKTNSLTPPSPHGERGRGGFFLFLFHFDPKMFKRPLDQ